MMIPRRFYFVPLVLVLFALLPALVRAQDAGTLREQIEKAKSGKKEDSTSDKEEEKSGNAARSPRRTIRWENEERRAVEQRNQEAEGDDNMVEDAELPESEVHAAINPTDSNNIIVVPIEYDRHTAKFTCRLYYTTDLGRTWKKSAFATVPKVETTNTDAGDPVVAFDANGRAYVVWIDLYNVPNDQAGSYYGLLWAYSDDGGATWKQAEHDAVALAHNFTGSNETYDKEWIAVDRTSSSRRNTVYLAYYEIGATPTPRIVVRSMAPGSMRFNDTVSAVSDGTFERVQVTSIDVDVDGRVHVVFYGERSSGTYGIWHVLSSDGGAHFSPPMMIAPVTLNMALTPNTAVITTMEGVSQYRMYPFPQIASDASNHATRGNLYVAWTAAGTTSDRGDGFDIYLSRSTDHGATWSEPLIVNDDPRGLLRHQHHSSISVSPDGAVAVTWYDRRDDPRGRLARYSIAYSFDGGATFTPTMPVASREMDFLTIGDRNYGLGIGEYTQAVTTRGYAIPVWADGRTNDGDINIYAAQVPIAQSVSAVDRVTAVSEELTVGEPDVAGNELALALRLAEPGRLSVRLHDAEGRLRMTLADAVRPAGHVRVSGSTVSLPSGRYFIEIEAPGGHAVRSFVLVR